MKKIVIMAMASAVLMSGCADNQPSIAVNGNVEKTAEVNSNAAVSAPGVLLSETPDKKVAVYGKAQGESFISLTVQINGESKTYDWTNVDNPSFYPEISLITIDDVAEDEVVIILTTGTGTGVRDSKVHILTSDFTEIPVADPREAAMSKITVDLKKEKEVRKYTVSIDGKESAAFDFKESDSSDWFDRPTVKNILRYSITNDVLTAEMPLQISVGNYLGSVIVKYELVDGKFEPAKIEVIKEGSS